MTDVDQMVLAYQGTIKAAGELDSKMEYAIVVAAVLDNARAFQHRTVVGRPGGDTEVARLRGYIAELEADDKLRKAFDWARKKAVHTGQAIAGELFKAAFFKSAPALTLSIIGVVATLSGWLHDAGKGVGAALGTAFLGATAFALARPGQFASMVSKLPTVGSSIGAGFKDVGQSWIGLTRSAGTVGNASAKVLDANLRPVAHSIQGAAAGTAGFQWPQKTRGTLQCILYGTSLVVAAATLIVGFGIIDGFAQATNDPSRPCTTNVFGRCV